MSGHVHNFNRSSADSSFLLRSISIFPYLHNAAPFIVPLKKIGPPVDSHLVLKCSAIVSLFDYQHGGTYSALVFGTVLLQRSWSVVQALLYGNALMF